MRVELSPEQLGQLALQLSEHLEPPARVYFGELAEEWLERVTPRRVSPHNERSYVRQHLHGLFLETEDTLTATLIEDHIRGLTLAPSTKNKVRGAGRLIIELAQAGRRWGALNPFALATRLPEPPAKYELLTLAELRLVQQHLTPLRRRMLRTQLHLGLRTGELLGMMKEDVDLEAGTVLVRRSHDRDETKTGPERLIPIHPAIAGDLLEQKRAAGTDLMFPKPDGTRQRKDTKLCRVLRSAMANAGVGLLEVIYKCRRSGCGEVKISKPPVLEVDCDVCEFRMWPFAEVRPVRWYDLRHMAATLHHQHGADPLCVALALGHSVNGTTHAIYTHPSIETLARELTKWHLPG